MRNADSTRTILLALITIGCSMAAAAASADTLLVGPEIQINTYTTGTQSANFGNVASRPDGSFIAVFDSDTASSGDDVFGRLFDADGVPAGPEFQINTYTTGDQRAPIVAAGPAGSAVVVWIDASGQDGDGFGVFARRLDASGSPVGTDFQVNTYTTSSELEPAVAVVTGGSFLIVWGGAAGKDGDSSGIFGQRFDASGAPVGTEFQVNTYTTSQQEYPSIAAQPDGGFMVVWASFGPDGDGVGIFRQRFDTSGTKAGGEVQVNTYTTGSQNHPSISAAGDGSFQVVWGGPGGGGQRFDPTGAPIGTEFEVSGGTPVIASDADGSFLVVWRGSDADGDGIDGQQFDATGTPDGVEFQINSYTTGNQSIPVSVASNGTGRFVVSWRSDGQDGDGLGMFGQRLCTDADSDGECDTRCPTAPAPGCIAAPQAKIDYNAAKVGKEKLKLEWKKLVDATVFTEFGEPVGGTTEVVLCIYDDADTLVQEHRVDRAGELCAGKPCWKPKGNTGYGYKDKESSADGVSRIRFSAGDAGKGKANARGKNNATKGQTSLPTGLIAKLTGNTAPTIQMHTSEGFCSSATMNQVKTDGPARYAAQLK